jgi:hypothetical protein
MINIMDVSPGDIIRMKKKHPCGSDEWLVLDTGVDFRIRCTGCDRLLLIERAKLEHKIKSLASSQTEGK